MQYNVMNPTPISMSNKIHTKMQVHTLLTDEPCEGRNDSLMLKVFMRQENQREI